MKKTLFALALALFFVPSCKKPANQHPFKLGNETIVAGTTRAKWTVEYSFSRQVFGVKGFLSLSSDMSDPKTFPSEISDTSFVITFDSLQGNTTYYCQYEIEGFPVITSEVKSFTTNDYGLPILTTSEVYNITATTATCGGDVFDDGGHAVTARGVCWSTSQNPTIGGSNTIDGSGTGLFTSSMTGLNGNTTYYVRAYATNSAGTAYGEQKTFETLPAGVISGLFSVSATKRVYFSQGNLQYQASTGTWRFANNQYECIGSDNENISSTYSGWIDLFGWGTGDNPTNTSGDDSDYSTFTDWGNNAISNGGNAANTWRTLTKDEWNYVANTRNTGSGIRYAKAQVNGVNGLILLPDNWSSSTYSLNNTSTSYYADFTDNVISSTEWIVLQDAGAVFLPAAGYRPWVNVYGVDSYGEYWSSTSDGSGFAWRFYFNYGGVYMYNSNRCYGFSVRLVQDF